MLATSNSIHDAAHAISACESWSPLGRSSLVGASDLPTATRAINALYDAVLPLLLDDNDVVVASSIAAVVSGLGALRATLSAKVWLAAAKECRGHQAVSIMHEDPFTRRTFTKPRGFPGDAAMLDLIYGLGDYTSAYSLASERGRMVNAGTFSSLACRSVRHRRHLLAGHLRECLANHDAPRVFALAGGHVRELQLLRTYEKARIKEFLVGDLDTEALKEVERSGYGSWLETRPMSVRGLLSGQVPDKGFHLAYAAGLYDYLSDEHAIMLTQTMAKMLVPGGRLIVPNFVHSCHDRGYMEAVMDWNLVYRDEADLHRLAQMSFPEGGVRAEVRRGPVGQISYLILDRE